MASKVLLVEDDNNLREIYEARLQAEGYDIVSAKDGEEALVIAKKERPELIISDVMMPRISGFEMLDILRNTEGLKDVKVIMLTALGQAEDKTRADQLGADRYLVKSQVTLEDIVKSAQDLLSNGPATPAVQPRATPAPTVPATPPPVIPMATPPATPVPTTPPVTPVTPPTPSQLAPLPAAPSPTPPVVPTPGPATTPTAPPAPVGPPTPMTPPVPAAPPAANGDHDAANAQLITEALKGLTSTATLAQPASKESTQPATAPPVIPLPAAPSPTPPVVPTPGPATTPTAPPAPVGPPTPMTPPVPAPAVPITPPTPAVPATSETPPTPAIDEAAIVEKQIEDFAKPTPEPASTPDTSPLTLNKAPAPSPPTPKAEDDDNVVVAHKKIIKPIDAPDDPGPDLNELLAREGIGADPTSGAVMTPEQTAAASLPKLTDDKGGLAHPPGHVISPTPGDGTPPPIPGTPADSAIDPNSIAL
jgi:CheY-like chemotaxis protein